MEPAAHGKLERAPVTRSQQFLLVVGATSPYRPDGVDDVTRGKAKPGRDFGITRSAAAEGSARVQKLWTGGIVDSAVYTASPEEGIVRGVYDRTDIESRDIGADGSERWYGIRHHLSRFQGADYIRSLARHCQPMQRVRVALRQP
jgi:hypothetical protein